MTEIIEGAEADYSLIEDRTRVYVVRPDAGLWIILTRKPRAAFESIKVYGPFPTELAARNRAVELHLLHGVWWAVKGLQT